MRNVPFARVDCSGNELAYVKEVLDSGWLTTASKATELEKRFAEFLGVNHALAVNSCTSGLHLALDAIGVKRGDKVLVPTMTFTSSAEVIRYMGAEPVPVDVDPDTSLVTAPILKEALDKDLSINAVIVVHYGGQAALMKEGNGRGILSLCESRGVKVIEDAAHAFPTKQNGEFVGTFGDITCFSFYANKTMTTGDGGMVVTSSDEYAERIRLMRVHGIDRDVWKRYTDMKCSWEYDVVAPGFKYNMPDLNAAIGLAQLERVEDCRVNRMVCAQRYIEAFEGVKTLRMLTRHCGLEEHSWHLFPILMNGSLEGKRDEFIDHLKDRGVGVSVHYKPLHRLSYYCENFGLEPENFPGAEKLWQSSISLPIFSSLTELEQDYVISAVLDTAEILSYDQIKERS